MTKFHISIFLSFLLLGSIACTDSNSGNSSGKGSSKFEVYPDYEDRSYNYGETIGIILRIEETATSEDHCLFSIRAAEGTADFSIDDKPVVPGEPQVVYYNIINETTASKVLHFKVTPSPCDKVMRNVAFDLCVCGADGTRPKEKHIEISIRNTSEIVPDIQYSKAPLELTDTLDMIISAQKQGYTGDFTMSADILQGLGTLLLDGKPLGSKETFAMSALSSRQIRYRPSAHGTHRLAIEFSDSEQHITKSIDCEVVEAAEGAYIYTVDGSYIRPEEWNSELQAEGVALITPHCRFLMAPKCCGVDTWCLPDNIQLIPGIIIPEREQALQDYNGKRNTEIILQALKTGILKRADMAQACSTYDPARPGRWYMPAAGQMHIITLYFEQVQACLKAIGCSEIKKGIFYYSSTGWGHAWAYAFYLPNLYVSGCTINVYRGECYPVRDL